MASSSKAEMSVAKKARLLQLYEAYTKWEKRYEASEDSGYREICRDRMAEYEQSITRLEKGHEFERSVREGSTIVRV